MREEEGGNAGRLIIRPPHIPAGGLIGNRIPARGGTSARGVASGYSSGGPSGRIGCH